MFFSIVMGFCSFYKIPIPINLNEPPMQWWKSKTNKYCNALEDPAKENVLETVNG